MKSGFQKVNFKSEFQKLSTLIGQLATVHMGDWVTKDK